MLEQRRRGVAFVTTLLILGLILGSSCYSAAYVIDADQEVEQILRSRTRRVLDRRKRTRIYPQPAAQDKALTTEPAGKTQEKVLEIDLESALEIAVEKNRDYLTRQEALYTLGLGYSLVRFGFGPQLTSTVSLVWGDSKGGLENLSGSVTGGASQLLPSGGTLSLSSGFTNSRTRSVIPQRAYSANVGISLSQPLLRGAGYEVSHEALTSAERGLIYSIRDFELFRESFSIQVAQAFFDLISRQQTLANEDANYAQAKKDREKAEALFKLERNTEQEVFRAKRREIEAENQLIEQRAAFESLLDQFKIRLGLPTTVRLNIQPYDPEVIPVDIEIKSAVAAARNNRLDIHTQRDRVDDVERALRIADNGLLADIRLTMSYDLAETHDTLSGALPDDWSGSAGLSIEIPIQQKASRNAYRTALIAREQVKRAYSLTLDNLELNIRNQLRTLTSLEKQIELQKGQIEQEHRAVAVTQIRYESGDLDNRDLLEARAGLINSQNALIRQRVSHFIGRLNLMRTLGILSIDNKGMWQ